MRITTAISTVSLALIAIAGSAIASEPIKGIPLPGNLVQRLPVPGEVAVRRSPLRYVPLRTMDHDALARGKAAARARGRAHAPAPKDEEPGIRTTTVGKNSPGIASDQTVTPPDSTGSIGPQHYIEMVNAQVGVYNRNLVLLDQIDLDTFVGKPSDGQCDPQMQWDPQARRWFYAALDCDGGTPNFLLFGWSKNHIPLPLPSAGNGGNWCQFQINTGNLLDDYPKLGHNNTHIVIGTNVFQGNNFRTSRIWAIPKPANGDTSCAVPSPTSFGSPASPLKTADGDTAFTPIPANAIHGGPNAYVTAADFPGGGPANQVMVWHISGPAGAPVLTEDGNVRVPTYDFPANIPQPGTANTLDSSDTRLTQSVSAKDPGISNRVAIWTQHTVDFKGGRSAVRWYEIVPSLCRRGICPASALRQKGTIAAGKHFAFNGAVSPTRAGNSAAIQFNVGSSTLLAQIHTRTRVGTDPLNRMGGNRRLGTSSTFAQDFSCSPCRWGDYAALNPDPANKTTVWGTNMGIGPAAGANAHWTTRNFSVSP
jgi:hypothetical protein